MKSSTVGQEETHHKDRCCFITGNQMNRLCFLRFPISVVVHIYKIMYRVQSISISRIRIIIHILDD